MATHSNILTWEIPLDRGAWWATVRKVTESDMTEQLNNSEHLLYNVVLVSAVQQSPLEICSSVANQNCNEVSSHTGQNGHHQKVYK